MNIRRKPMEFHNVVKKSISDEQYNIDDVSEVRLNLMQKGVFVNGPLIIEGKWENGLTNLMFPVSAEIEFVEHTDFSFLETLRCDDGIYYRDGAEEFDQQSIDIFLHNVAKDLEVELEDYFYCIVLNVYGGKLYDVYAPIKK